MTQQASDFAGRIRVNLDNPAGCTTLQDMTRGLKLQEPFQRATNLWRQCVLRTEGIPFCCPAPTSTNLCQSQGISCGQLVQWDDRIGTEVLKGQSWKILRKN